MSSHIEKEQDSNVRLNTNITKSERQSSSQGFSSASVAQQAANSSSYVTQLQAMQQMANSSPYVTQLHAMQQKANNSPAVQQGAQQQAMADQHTSSQHPIQKKENKTGLPDNLKSGIENLSGYAMDDVKVHRNSDKPAQMQAHAYAQGTDIHLAPGQEKHLPHEAWHVVQQKQGRVKPTMQMKGKVNINDDAGLEKEADVMGSKAIQVNGNVNKNRTVANTSFQNETKTMQRKVAIATQDVNEDKDWVILSNLHYAKNKLVGGGITDLGPNADFSDMKTDENLAIVGHGSAGNIEGFDAFAIIRALVAPGKALPKSTNRIILLSCSAAKPTEPTNIKSSLVGTLSNKLNREYGYKIKVEGKPSFAQNHISTGMNSTKPSQEANHMAIEKPLIKKHKLCITKKPSRLNDERKLWFIKNFENITSENINKNEEILCRLLVKKNALKLATEIISEEGLDPKKMTLEQRAEYISNRTADLYIELEKKSKQKGTLFNKGRGKGSGTAIGYFGNPSTH